jgi:hypothetical protein
MFPVFCGISGSIKTTCIMTYLVGTGRTCSGGYEARAAVPGQRQASHLPGANNSNEVIGVILFDDVGIPVIKIHVYGSMVACGGCGPAVSLFPEDRVDKEPAVTVFLTQNEAAKLVPGGIPPVIISCKPALVHGVHICKAVFPDHSLL